MLKPLVLHLKREYWEAVRDGRKKEEYRERGPYWGRRIRNKEFSEVVLLLGYPKAGDESRTLRRKWQGYTEKTIDHPHFGARVPVFAIDVSEEVNYRFSRYGEPSERRSAATVSYAGSVRTAARHRRWSIT